MGDTKMFLFFPNVSTINAFVSGKVLYGIRSWGQLRIPYNTFPLTKALIVETFGKNKNIFVSPIASFVNLYVATSYRVGRQETFEISEQRTGFVWFFAQEVDWCMKDCGKQRLQTTVSINLWKILAGHTGDWFDVKTASICATELWEALKSFILTSLKFKVALYPIIVSLDTLRCLIQLRNRELERTRLATATTSRFDASQWNQTADFRYQMMASHGWFFFFFLAR